MLRKLILLLICLNVFLASCTDSDGDDAGVRSYRRAEGKIIADLGIYVSNAPTTNQFELAAVENNFDEGTRYSGDKLIDRDTQGYDAEKFKTEGGVFYFKIKVLLDGGIDGLDALPATIDIVRGSFGDLTPCRSEDNNPATTVPHTSKYSGETQTYQMCTAFEEQTKFNGAPIFYIPVLPDDQGAVEIQLTWDADFINNAIGTHLEDDLNASVTAEGLYPFDINASEVVPVVYSQTPLTVNDILREADRLNANQAADNAGSVETNKTETVDTADPVETPTAQGVPEACLEAINTSISANTNYTPSTRRVIAKIERAYKNRSEFKTNWLKDSDPLTTKECSSIGEQLDNFASTSWKSMGRAAAAVQKKRLSESHANAETTAAPSISSQLLNVGGALWDGWTYITSSSLYTACLANPLTYLMTYDDSCDMWLPE